MGLFNRKKPDLTIEMTGNDVTVKFLKDKQQEAGRLLGKLVISLSYKMMEENDMTPGEYTNILEDSLETLDDYLNGGNEHD